MKQKLLLLLVALLPMLASAYDAEINGIYYNFSGDEATVTYRDSRYSSYSGRQTIPSSVSYNSIIYHVTSIGASAFSDCNRLTSVTIPNSVTSIGSYAFRDCSSLTSIAIPNSVTSIGGGAFSDCIGLTSVTIPNSVTSIGSGAFYGTVWYDNQPDGLVYAGKVAYEYKGTMPEGTEIAIKDGTLGIADEAFYQRHSLTSVTIPNSVTSIGYGAFAGCSGLTSVTVPESVTSIGSGAFYGTVWYDNQPDGLVYAGKVAYKYKGTMPEGTEIVIKDGTSGIAGSAFAGCSDLTSVTIPSSVTSIGNYAFDGCSGLTSVTIPESVTSIGGGAFSDCIGLTSVTIGSGVTSIGDFAFYNCSSLTSVTIPNSVTSIGWSAFYGCSDLTSITLDSNAIASVSRTQTNSMESIFGGQVMTYIIGKSVTSIGDYAFYNCKRLTSIIIGSGVLSIGNRAFLNTSLKKVIWLTNTPPSGYTNLRGEVNYVANELYTNLYNVTVYPYLSSLFEVEGVKYVPVSPSERTCDAIDCAYNESAEHIDIGETVTYRGITLSVGKINPYLCYGNTFIKDSKLHFKGDIAALAFSGCSAMQTAELGQGITSIGSSAFSGCGNLEGIVIPDAVNLLGNNSFDNCSSMTFVKIGSGINTIPTAAFIGCSSLPIIQIPQCVATIEDYVFNGCTGLKTILMDDGETELTLGSNNSKPLFADCPLDSVYIGRDINYSTSSSYGYSPFYRNTYLRSVNITDKETEISQNEFYGCTNLKNVRIGDGVTTFGDWAFSGCSSLDYFSFGSSVETIGKEAFSDCTAMTRLISKAAVPPVCGSQALDDINKWECSLYVPDGALASYQQAEQWKEFWFMQIDPDAIGDVKAENVDVKNRYDIQGHKIAKPQKGINIIRMSDGTTRKVMVK